MRQRLILFLLGLGPIFSLDIVRGLDGVKSGTTIANLILCAGALVLGVAFVFCE